MNASGRSTVIAAVSVTLALAAVSFGMMTPGPSDGEISSAVEALFKPLPFTPGEFGNASSTGAAMAADGSLSPQARAEAEAGIRAENMEVAAALRAGAVDGETHARLVRMVAQRTDRTDGEAARQIDQVLNDMKMKAQAARAERLKLALPASILVLLAGGLVAWAARRA